MEYRGSAMSECRVKCVAAVKKEFRHHFLPILLLSFNNPHLLQQSSIESLRLTIAKGPVGDSRQVLSVAALEEVC